MGYVTSPFFKTCLIFPYLVGTYLLRLWIYSLNQWINFQPYSHGLLAFVALFIVGYNGLESDLPFTFLPKFSMRKLEKLLAMHRTINFYFLNYFLKSLLHNIRGSACWNSQCKPVCAQQHGQCLFIHLYFIDYFRYFTWNYTHTSQLISKFRYLSQPSPIRFCPISPTLLKTCA